MMMAVGRLLGPFGLENRALSLYIDWALVEPDATGPCCTWQGWLLADDGDDI